jgi:predicted transcriptional regulator
MKTFTFHYNASPRAAALKSIKDSMRAGKMDIQKDSISCKSMDEMMKLISKARFQVFIAIVEQSPSSLTDLAEILHKDLGNVQRDAKVLESLGLIELKKMPSSRGDRLKPIALYDRIVFECEPKLIKKAAGF